MSKKGGSLKLNVYNCFSQKLAGFLLINGFSIIGVKSDLKMTGRSVYMFVDSDLLRKVVSRYKEVSIE